MSHFKYYQHHIRPGQVLRDHTCLVSWRVYLIWILVKCYLLSRLLDSIIILGTVSPFEAKKFGQCIWIYWTNKWCYKCVVLIPLMWFICRICMYSRPPNSFYLQTCFWKVVTQKHRVPFAFQVICKLHLHASFLRFLWKISSQTDSLACFNGFFISN